MKLVRENISFQRGVDPKTSLSIGRKALIDEWFKTWAPDVYYTIDSNLNIEVKGSLDLSEKNVDILPENLTVRGYLNLYKSSILNYH